MLRKIHNLLKVSSKENFFRSIVELEENSWILTDRYYMKVLWLLISSMSKKHIKFFSKTSPLLFLKSQGRLASSVHQIKTHHIIIIYPQTLALMKGIEFEKAAAILAHELGHIYYEHAKKKLSPLQAQVQADQFAADLGLGLELQQVLLENDDFLECRVRVSYLTSRLITRLTLSESSSEKSSIARS